MFVQSLIAAVAWSLWTLRFHRTCKVSAASRVLKLGFWTFSRLAICLRVVKPEDVSDGIALPDGNPRASQDCAAVVRRRWADIAVNYLAVPGRVSKHLGGMYCVVLLVHPPANPPLVRGRVLRSCGQMDALTVIAIGLRHACRYMMDMMIVLIDPKVSG